MRLLNLAQLLPKSDQLSIVIRKEAYLPGQGHKLLALNKTVYTQTIESIKLFGLDPGTCLSHRKFLQ